MASLFDTINNNLRNSASFGPQATGMQDSTAQIQKLSAAKSGRAVSGGSTPRMSNVQEQVATYNAGQQLAQQKQQVAIQAETLAQQSDFYSQQAAQASQQLDAKRIETQENYSRQVDSILRDLSRSERELSFRKDAAKVEQAGFLLRLQNDQYLSNLEIEARKSQLDSEIAFKEELTRTLFEEEQELFTNSLYFRSLLNADDRRFAEEMGALDLDFALEMAEAESNARNQQMIWSGVGSMVGAGADAWAKYGGKKTTTGNTDG